MDTRPIVVITGATNGLGRLFPGQPLRSGRELPSASVLAGILTRLRIGDPRRGAAIIVRLATDPAFADINGGFFAVEGAKPLECPEAGRDEAVQRALWDATAELLRDIRRPAAG